MAGGTRCPPRNGVPEAGGDVDPVERRYGAQRFGLLLGSTGPEHRMAVEAARTLPEEDACEGTECEAFLAYCRSNVVVRTSAPLW